jgi:hypothetical protein
LYQGYENVASLVPPYNDTSNNFMNNYSLFTYEVKSEAARTGGHAAGSPACWDVRGVHVV